MCTHTYTTSQWALVNQHLWTEWIFKRNMAYAEPFVCCFHIHMDARVAGIQSSSCSPRCEQMTLPRRKPASSCTSFIQLIRREGKNSPKITQHLGKSVTENELPLSRSSLNVSLIWTWRSVLPCSKQVMFLWQFGQIWSIWLRFCKLVGTKSIINDKAELNFALMHLLKIT